MKYKRILLKLSGESLMGDGEYGIDSKMLTKYANEINEIIEHGIEVAIVIGGGKSSLQHIEGIKEFIARQNGEICIIHASSKNAAYYEDIKDIEQYFCLVGSEGHRLEKVFNTFKNFHGTCILPPFPRKMGTYVPTSVMDMSFELAKSDIDYSLNDTHTILALQTAIELKVEELYLVGYDGYPMESISAKEHELFIENQSIFNSLKGKLNIFEIKRPELDAYLVASSVARQIENRISYKRAIKMAIQATMRMNSEGIKIQISGRLNGAEMARSEHYKDGRIPLSTFRADIDYALVEAHTTYGRLGIKVWIMKGEVYGKRELSPLVGLSKGQDKGGRSSNSKNRRRK